MRSVYHVEFTCGHCEKIILTDEEALLYWCSEGIRHIEPVSNDGACITQAIPY